MITAELNRPSLSDEALEAFLPLVGVVPVEGPPVILIAGPWIFLALLLAGPFAFLLTLVLLLVVAVGTVGMIGAIVAMPFMLARRRRGTEAAPMHLRAFTPQFGWSARWDAC